jgi:hypothetical protein
MPLTAAQICTKAASIARVPGFTSQAGDYLNVVLQELCQNYDFDVAKQTYYFTFNTNQLNFNGQAYQNLPANYLRTVRNECFYYISGVPYPMIHFDQAEGDLLVQQAGVTNFPVFFWTDMTLMGATNSPTTSPGVTGVPIMLFWMPPSGAYQVTLRYFSQMSDIATPASSSTVPWFPDQNYLITRVAGQLMQDADDERWMTYLSDDKEGGAGYILGKYLKLKDDKSDRAQTVKLDRRVFGRAFDRLRNTKQIGW